MPKLDETHPLTRFLYISAAIVFIVWGAAQAQGVLVALLVSAFLAILSTPPVIWLENKRVPVLVAVFIVVLSMVVILVSLGVVVGTSINSFYEALPQYEARLQEQLTRLEILLAEWNVAAPNLLLSSYFKPEAVMNLTATLVGWLSAAFSNILMIVLSVTFILLEVHTFPIKLRTVLGDPLQVFPRFAVFASDMRRYVVIKTLMSLITGILVSILLWILHIPFPILWGFVAFLLNYVPTIGSGIAAIPAVLLALIQFGIARGVIVALGYLALNLILDYGIEKRLMGRQLGISTLIVFLSLIVWGSLLGPIGAILCIPLTMTLKFAFESNKSTRWVGVLLGSEKLSSITESAIEK